jgi:hypothetical protein
MIMLFTLIFPFYIRKKQAISKQLMNVKETIDECKRNN